MAAKAAAAADTYIDGLRATWSRPSAPLYLLQGGQIRMPPQTVTLPQYRVERPAETPSLEATVAGTLLRVEMIWGEPTQKQIKEYDTATAAVKADYDDWLGRRERYSARVQATRDRAAAREEERAHVASALAGLYAAGREAEDADSRRRQWATYLREKAAAAAVPDSRTHADPALAAVWEEVKPGRVEIAAAAGKKAPRLQPPTSLAFASGEANAPTLLYTQKPVSGPQAKTRVVPEREEAKRAMLKESLVHTELPFANKEECESRKRAARHYLSREDLVDVIDRKPSLRARFSRRQDYRAMSKEELCSVLFVYPPPVNGAEDAKK